MNLVQFLLKVIMSDFVDKIGGFSASELPLGAFSPLLIAVGLLTVMMSQLPDVSSLLPDF